MQKTAPVLVLVSSIDNMPRILLVKTQAGWGAPVGEAGEDVATLIAQVRSGVLHPATTIEAVPGYHKTLHPDATELEVTLAVASDCEVRPFLEAPQWYDARFSSFEEASYILQPSQEKLLSWCERVVPKALKIPTAA